MESVVVIDADKLFVENGIDKIKFIQIQTQTEIEKKREELRSMVGERYRDLLKAANTITEMEHTAGNVIKHINNTESLCKSLQHKICQVFKNSRKISVKELEDISSIIEIKILLSLPEQIWITIDNKNYLFGAELFLFANHIHLDIDLSPNGEKIKEEYPVVSKQWEVITSYRNIIINRACNQLKEIDISYEICRDCLCCITFLDTMSYDQLIDHYFELRMAKLEEIIQSEDVIRNKLTQIILLIQNTLSAVYHCFLGDAEGKCSIDKRLEKIISDHAKPTFAKMSQAISLPDHYLSLLIKDFRPSVKKELNCLTNEVIQNKSLTWMESARVFLNIELTKLLKLVSDVKRLHKIIKDDVCNIKYHKDWKTIVSTVVCMENLNVYDHFIKPTVTIRVVEIIGNVWETSIGNVMSLLKEIDEEISKDRLKYMENDIRWFVWKENIMDTHMQLRLKTQGYTSRVMKLCNCFENSLKNLLEEIELYVGESFSESKVEIESDVAHILLFLNRCSLDMIKRLSKKISESCKEGTNLTSESGIIVRARFLQSLAVQSPSLEKCLKQGQRQVLKELSENDLLNSWPESFVFLNEESAKIWLIWKELTIVKLKNLIKTKLSGTISLRALLASKALNEVISIEEQTEDGKGIQSEIRIPSQPSLPLQDLLFQACQLLNGIIPHTLPRKIHEDLVNAFVKHILEHYEDWSKSKTIYQSQAWQMLLDVRFVTLLLITHENKDFSQSICDALEKIIDPFDFDVHYPHLQNSVKKSTLRLQGTVGVLINFREKLPVFNGLKLTQNDSSLKVEEPNVLAMSDMIPWFTLLTVANHSLDSTISKESTPEKIVKTKEKENRRESKSRDFVKSANAFLNAMTSRWS